MRTTFVVLTVVAGVAAAAHAQASSLDRDRDPVVMVGADLPDLTGLAVNLVVAFRYDDGWQQIPVQIDERKVVEFSDVYNGLYGGGVFTTAYTDPNTYCGADTDPTFDSDDELVFMAKDAGDRAGPGSGEPSGVVAGSGVELEISDSLDSGTGYVYLFVSNGSLTPDAGQDYVNYTFDLLAGEYIPNYDLADGPNPEDSVAWSAYYRTRFADRWIRDEVNVYAGGATGVDILDRHKNMFSPGECGRTEDTFSDGEGAFFANKDGPVRAIRSYMGANSGPLTQRVHRFYEQRQDIATHLRVHVIPSVMDLYDYSPAATGMTYYNDVYTSGVTIDGVPDSVGMAQITWEMVTGAQGALLLSHAFETDITLNYIYSYYSDDSTPSTTQCTGDDYEYGTSGLWVAQIIPNTDPLMGEYYYLTSLRRVGYAAPGQTITDAALHHDQVTTPLTVSSQSYDPTYLLTLSVRNDAWGSVDFDPEPNDANSPAYPPQTAVTLTAQPIGGKSFREWLIFDPNHPGDANHAVTDANIVLHLTMDGNQEVEAAFKCGTGVEPFVGAVLLVLTLGILRRRR